MQIAMPAGQERFGATFILMAGKARVNEINAPEIPKEKTLIFLVRQAIDFIKES